MRRYGIDDEEADILPTSGSQQALDLLGKVFLDPGDHVVVERPTYLGALQAWRAFEAGFAVADTDQEGMVPDSLPPHFRGGPKFVYTLPNFQNPTGATLPLERRRELVRQADHYGVPIVEDDPYGQLRYRGTHLPPLFAVDAGARRGRRGEGNVIYLSSFSKTLAPGLRLGWIVAPREVVERLVLAKQGADLHTSTLVQLLAHEVSRRGFLDRHVRRLRALYHSRCDAMLAAMSRHFPAGVRWTRPHGGLFVWAALPPGLDATEVLHVALVEKVAFVPGAAFYAGEPQRNTLRLNFSNAPEDRIEEGIRRLGHVLGQMLAAAAERGEAPAVPRRV
jgi:2-aminoadipate transaminase